MHFDQLTESCVSHVGNLNAYQGKYIVEGGTALIENPRRRLSVVFSIETIENTILSVPYLKNCGITSCNVRHS